ncbi:hypothetical protein SCB71_14545 [Herbiconiux sp. KACC 21604]|uniref:hypothetical protein n=1 Tax=unclassified Herbiconiux TaxID=2618217 RepID=UPI001490D5F0|nr:hypothetical protein [Herbiconiux sp. SALV-R1]QJU54362.1 hypothetical protein HL652_12485 [Herbiconiux sp. SALV-R1]WPO85432.1 hypothetical protein SCB71_14545 [Herbiconiux sp. KACC 21604]
MPIMNYTTDISVTKTMGEIQGALARRGVTRISTLFDEHGVASGLGFTMNTDYGPRDFELPVRTAGVLEAMKRDTKVPRSKCTTEQAAKVAWRIAKDWLEAQSALIDAQLARLDEVMFPYMIASDEGTVYELFRGKQLEISASNRAAR